MTRRASISKAAVAATVLLGMTGAPQAPLSVNAAPTNTPQWIVQVSSDDLTQHFGEVKSLYASEGLGGASVSAFGNDAMVFDDSLGMLVVPAGDEEFRERLTGIASSGSEVKVFENTKVYLDDPIEKEVEGSFAVWADIPSSRPAGALSVDGNATASAALPGEGVLVVIIDSGLDANHPEFGGRAEAKDMTGTGDRDIIGHGSHVASIAAGEKLGVAPGAKILGLKVFSGETADTSHILAALQEVANIKKQNPKQKIAVNMSLGVPVGGGRPSPYDAILKSLRKNNVPVMIAAGNENQDACRNLPGSIPDAVTVSAVDSNQQKASFANYNKCVDIFALGVEVMGVKPYTKGVVAQSGTSMASPQVTGKIAKILSEQEGDQDGEDAIQNLFDHAKAWEVKGSIGSATNLVMEDAVNGRDTKGYPENPGGGGGPPGGGGGGPPGGFPPRGPGGPPGGFPFPPGGGGRGPPFG